MDTISPAKDVDLQSTRERSGFLRLLSMLAATTAVVYLTALALVLWVPEQNDYALASNLKHDRLETLPGDLVILVGGSNLAYGIDSKAMEAATDCAVVNMGMNGYFGVRYLLEEIKPSLHAGDVVVMAFEWDNYFKSIDGTSANLLAVSKANPRAFGYMSWGQRLLVATDGVAYVARQKALRLVGDGLSYLDSVVRGDLDDDDSDALLTNIEVLAGFNSEGDLTSHLGIEWPFERGQGIDLTGNGIDPDVVEYIADFAREMRVQGIGVVMSYTPVMRSYYALHAGVIERVHDDLVATGSMTIPRPPSDYVYDDSMFFDEAYHLSDEGRQERTAQLAGDVLAAKAGTCGGAADASSN